MSVSDKFKENKKLIIIAAGAVVIIVALLVFVLPNLGQKEEETGPEVVSKRVKIDVKTQAPTAVAAKPGEAAKPAPTAVAAKPAKAAPQATAQAEAAKAAPEQKHEKPKKTKKAAVSTMPWALNVSSFITDNEAQALRKKLKASGYNAYVSRFEKDGMTWYRVRVGFYRTSADAKKAGKKIMDRFKVDHEPWILKPARSEAAKHFR